MSDNEETETPDDGWGSRRHAAYHEAGHAIAALALRHGVRDVTIVPGDGYAGRTTHDVADLNPYPFEDQVAKSSMVICAAGGIAAALSRAPDEERPFADTPFVDDGTDGDTHEIAGWALSLWGERKDGDYGEEWVELVSQTRELVLANWVAVESLAAALVRHGTLDREMLRAVVDFLDAG